MPHIFEALGVAVTLWLGHEVHQQVTEPVSIEQYRKVVMQFDWFNGSNNFRVRPFGCRDDAIPRASGHSRSLGEVGLDTGKNIVEAFCSFFCGIAAKDLKEMPLSRVQRHQAIFGGRLALLS